MSYYLSNSESSLAESKSSKLSRISFDLMDKLIDFDPSLNGKIMIGGALGKRTITKYDDSIELFIVLGNKEFALEMLKKSESVTKLIRESEINCKFFISFHNLEVNEIRNLEPILLKRGSVHYLRQKYVLKFIKKFDSLIDIIKIAKIWNKVRKIDLDEIIIELVCIESFYRLKNEKIAENEISKSFFQTLHNAMEGISIIPREWFENDDIQSQVSDLGIRIVDPGDSSTNLANHLIYTKDLEIRNECLRAISLIESEKIESLLEES
ncbi:MAG: hypothetical protein ACW981_06350 [Candidatus Hodarchaeales archaeon]